MKKIYLFLIMFLLTGCSAEYNLNIEENIYNETFTVMGNYNEKIDNDTFVNVINDYNSKNILIDYSIQPGDTRNEDFPLYYNIYNKKLINDNYYGLELSYSYDKIEEYKKSTIVNELFKNVYLTDNFIKMSEVKDIYSNYPYLDNISISFKTDKIITSINSDEETDGIYYWYVNKDNYESKSINIEFTDSKLDVIANKTKKNADDFINIVILVVIVVILIGVVVVYERVKKSNK